MLALDINTEKTLALSRNNPSVKYTLIIAKHKSLIIFLDAAVKHVVDSFRTALAILKLPCVMAVFNDRVCGLQRTVSICCS